MLEQNKIYLGDCRSVMKDISAKIFSLAIVDPPYNIGKDSWDKFKSLNEYISFLGEVLTLIQEKLKDNGSMYLFHNDFEQLAEIQCWIKQNTNFKFKRLLVWDKYNGTPQNHPYKGALWKQVNSGGHRNYANCKEYILYYVLNDDDNPNTCKTLREYMREEKEKSGLTRQQIKEVCGFGNSKGASIIGHYFDNSQWELPTKEIYEKLQTTGYWKRSYGDLLSDFNSLRYTFNQPENNLSILQFPIPDKKERISHPTQKSIALIEHLIDVSSKESDLILSPFCGTGTDIIASLNKNRICVSIEKDEKYYKMALERTQKHMAI